MKKMGLQSWFLSALLTLAAGATHAAPTLEERMAQAMKTPQSMQTAAQAGKRTAQFCFNCHGTEGHSTHPETPNLAAQNSAYLLAQIEKFSNGGRKDPFMEGMIKALSDEEKVNIAVYFSTQTIQSHPGGNPAEIRRGQQLFSQVCHTCHGDKGLGNERIPRIASQQPAYVIKSLTRYRNGTGERRDPLMSNVAKQLSDSDINAVAAYVASM